MNIDDAVTTEYVAFDPSTPLSKIRGAFDEEERHVVLVTGDEGFEGVVTQARLLTPHQDPDDKAHSVLRPGRFAPRTPRVEMGRFKPTTLQRSSASRARVA